MKLCIFGASGQTGTQLLNLAIKKGNQVVASARTPSSIDAQEGLEVVASDVLDESTLGFLTEQKGIDHIAIALGTKELWGNTVRSQGTQNIISAAKKSGTQPHIWVISAAGVQDSWSQLGLVSKLFAKLLLPSVMREHLAQEKIVEASGLPYTFLRASGLTNANENTNYQIVTSGKLPNAQISRAALASCLLDCLEKNESTNTAITVTGN